MKITLKTDNDTLLAVDRMLGKAEYNTIISSITQRVTISLGLELSDIFHTRARKIIREANLLNNHKKRSLTLKYHQAWALEQIIRNENSFPKNNPYQISLLNALADELNQKLV